MIEKLKLKLKNAIDRALPVVLPLLCAGILVFLAAFAETNHSGINCNDVEVKLFPKSTGLIASETVRKLLDENGFSGLEGRPLLHLEMQEMESVIREHPHVEDVTAYFNLKGTLKFNVHQRVPYYRIRNRQGESFYVDRNGKKLPLSDNYTAHVLIVHGHISESRDKGDTLSTETGIAIHDLINGIKGDPFMNHLTGEVYVNRDGEFLITPRIGSLRIELGDHQDLDKKFKKLQAFYSQTLPRVGWDHYRTVNIKYKNQIIAK